VHARERVHRRRPHSMMPRTVTRRNGRVRLSVPPSMTSDALIDDDCIRGYHAHVYFRNADERARALRVRGWIDARFPVTLGRVHDVLVGPHGSPMYQVAFERAQFASLVPWLLLNRLGLSVLVHPNTGRARDDHLLHALWLGDPIAVRAEVLSNEPT